jgi:putative tricarboxylic transport membrane protein
MYGGSTTSILVRIPGEAASVVTCIDGYEMARQGRAGPALMIAAIGSAVGGVVSIIGLMLFAPPLAAAMLRVGPAAEFMLMLLALIAICVVSSGSALKTAAMILVGLLLATVGVDPLTAWPRFTFDQPRMVDGFSFVAVSIGLFGLSEILLNFEQVMKIKPQRPALRDLVPRYADLRASAWPIGRGAVIGFGFGIVPGVSHVVSTFVSYAVEKRLSKRPEEFGKGAIAGVAGPETANNATTGSSLIPLLVLGIPSIPSTAILLSALMIHGVQAGPRLIADHPAVFWGLIASMFVGNVILLVLNLPLVGIFVSLLRLPYGWLAPMVLLVSIVGVFGVSTSGFDLWVMTLFGALGYVLRKFEFDVAPLLLALVLGDRMEVGFRRALTISDGDYSIFFQGPAARLFLIALGLIAGLQLLAWIFGYRKSAVAEPEADQAK